MLKVNCEHFYKDYYRFKLKKYNICMLSLIDNKVGLNNKNNFLFNSIGKNVEKFCNRKKL